MGAQTIISLNNMQATDSPYLEKFGFRPPMMADSPKDSLELCVTIPSYKEPDLLLTLESLLSCDSFDHRTEVLVLFNAGLEDEQAIRTHQDQLLQCERWKKDQGVENIHFLLCGDLPTKTAGVGLARKILMDEASWRFERLAKDGVIVCLDADSTVAGNYIEELLKAAQSKAVGFAIHYEHPLTGGQDDEQYAAIIDYEIHLRYYLECMRFAGFPFAYHTVGSSMAVKSKTYQKQGGMNKRKAGEDFYFLNKIMALGDFEEINSTCVYPSARSSDRVPFGTGKAVGDKLAGKKEITTYDFRIFEELRLLFSQADALFVSNEIQVSATMRGFLDLVFFEKRVDEIRSNVGTIEAFRKRFFRWFDAFVIMKLAHYYRDHGFPNQQPVVACEMLFEKQGWTGHSNNGKSVLEMLRKRQKVVFAGADTGAFRR